MDLEEFHQLVVQSVAALPNSIRQRLSNVDIVVEEGESPGNSLFGFYHGVPQLRRGSGYGLSPTLPDKITIWKGTIERFAGSSGDVPALVRRVVWHEIGHHLGFDEAGVRRLEKKWEREKKI